MPVSRHHQIRPGTLVSIVLKADQRTGRQVQGTVAQLLTRGDHPRGIKVRLTDGRIGRVQQLLPHTLAHSSSTSRPSRTPSRTINMSSGHNPWQTAESQGNPYTGTGSEQAPQQQPQQPYQQYQSQQGSDYNPPPGPPPRIPRSDTDALLEQESDRAAQVEHMQNYEATANETEDDRNQAILQKEFPNIDSSLIAAIYGDSKQLGQTREMLQELDSGS